MEGKGEWTWVDSRGTHPVVWMEYFVIVFLLVGVPVEFAVLGGVSGLVEVLTFRAPNGGALASSVVYVAMLAPSIGVVLILQSFIPRRIGLGASGVRVDTRLRPLTIAWTRVRIGRKGWGLQWGTISSSPEHGGLSWHYPIDQTQAHAIVVHPMAPASCMAPGVREWAEAA